MISSLIDRVDEAEAKIVRKFVQQYPVKVGELATALGLKVTRTPLPPKISGLIKPSEEAKAKFEIRVNKYEVPERQRFTVAHEIAHYLLHRKEIGLGVIDSIMYRSNLTSRKETEANRLAADIVMPTQAINRELEKFGGRRTEEVAEEMATIFKVSVPAMKVRLGVT